MKILLATKLSDNKLKEKTIPIIKTKIVTSLEIIRYKKGLSLSKTRYYTPHYLLAKNIVFQLLAVFFLIPIRIILTRPDYLMAIYNIPYGIFMTLFGQFFKIPVIISLIGDDIHVYENKPFLWRFFINQWMKCHLITTTGTSTRKLLLKNGLPLDKVIALPNPVDTAKFFPQKIAKKYEIITVSYLIKRKRIDLLLEAITKIKMENGYPKVCIIGDGPDKDHLIKYCNKFGIMENVEFLGHVKNVNDYLHKSKIFLLSSEAEGMPVAVLEAMATGLAVIATNVGDTSDIITDMENGILINPNDSENLLKKIKYLLENPSEIERLGKNALNIRNTNSYNAISSIWDRILEMRK